MMIAPFLILTLLGFSNDLSRLQESILREIEGQNTVYGIAFKRLDTGESLQLNGSDQMHAASTMKVPVMMRIFEKIQAGELNLATQIPVTNRFQSIIDGSEYSITLNPEAELDQKVGSSETVEGLLFWMIAHSSNLATNLLIQVADAAKTRDLLGRLGVEGVLVLRGVDDLKAYEAGQSNRATASGMLDCMLAICTSELFSPSSREKMLEILGLQHYTHMIPAGIPKNSGARVANKTGSISTVQHDAAIVTLADGRRYGRVIFSRDFPGEPGRIRVNQTAALISTLVFEYMNP